MAHPEPVPEQPRQIPGVDVKEDAVRGIGVAGVAAAGLLLGCGASEQVSSSGDGDCTSFYKPIADASSRADLRQMLLEEVNPAVRSLRVIDEDPDDDEVAVILLNRRKHTVMSLDMWRQSDGTWTAQQWHQCID